MESKKVRLTSLALAMSLGLMGTIAGCETNTDAGGEGGEAGTKIESEYEGGEGGEEGGEGGEGGEAAEASK